MTGDAVVGIDVGGARKGFHAVCLRAGEFHSRTSSCVPGEIADWCLAINATAVAVDAPCSWSLSRHGRACEKSLAAEKISCFATPSEKVARVKAWYEWMRNGASLYAALIPSFPLFDGRMSTRRACMETFPQAVACALAGRIVSAKQKRHERAELLRSLGIDVSMLPNIDYIDAALCAVAASSAYNGTFKAYGDATDGLIVVPKARSSASGNAKQHIR